MYFFKMCIALIIIIIGMSMNFVVITNNEGKMPVSGNAMERAGWLMSVSDRHFIFYSFEDIKYPYLADIIYLGVGLASIGDILMCGGCGFLFMHPITRILKDIKKQRRKNANKKR